MLGIIGAMDEEVAKIKEKMEQVTIEKKASMEFCRGTLCGEEVVVVRCGIGKVNAAVCTQILIGEMGATAVINTGIAGSLDASIDIGDIVLSTDVVHHDMDAGGFGYALGQIPRMDVLGFEADASLRELAKNCCAKVNPDIHAFEGRVASGDQFISSKEKKQFITENFKASCTEMEGAAIAQAAYLNNTPFLIIRAISDKADESAHVDYPTFEAEAIAHSVNLIIEMVANGEWKK